MLCLDLLKKLPKKLSEHLITGSNEIKIVEQAVFLKTQKKMKKQMQHFWFHFYSGPLGKQEQVLNVVEISDIILIFSSILIHDKRKHEGNQI